MNIFRTIIETNGQKFLVYATHKQKRVDTVQVFPILQGVVAPEIQIDITLIKEQIQNHL